MWVRWLLLLVLLGLLWLAIAPETNLELITFRDLPVIGETLSGQSLNLGGFSGLFYEGTNPENGHMIFVTHTDRGPNAELIDTDGDGVEERPFAIPNFQPEVVRFEVNRQEKTIEIIERIPLTLPDGTPLTGIPNIEGLIGMAYSDEIPVDITGQRLPYNPFGGDLESIARADDGTYWMGDEYRPALYHFTAEGKLIARYVPMGSNEHSFTGIEALPAIFAQRSINRGFEGIAYADGKVYAFLQGPLDNPDVANDSNSEKGKGIRILEFDTASETTTAEYYYLLLGGKSDKIGDVVAIGQGEFLVLERDNETGPNSLKNIFRVNINGATNLMTLSPSTIIEEMSPKKLEKEGIIPVQKELFLDLVEVGYDMFDKVEGLALVDSNTVALINDNDFALKGDLNLRTGILEIGDMPEMLALYQFQ